MKWEVLILFSAPKKGKGAGNDAQLNAGYVLLPVP
jgi:hypothetical protein